MCVSAPRGVVVDGVRMFTYLICFLGFFGGFIWQPFVLAQRNFQEGVTRETQKIHDFLQRYDRDASNVCTHVMTASWNYHTNVTDRNLRNMLEIQLQAEEFKRRKWEEIRQFNWQNLNSDFQKRVFSFIDHAGISALPDSKRKELAELLQDMKHIYSEGSVCPYVTRRDRGRSYFGFEELQDLRNARSQVASDSGEEFFDPEQYGCIPTLKMEPDIQDLMSASRNEKELSYLWRAWRNKVGRPIRTHFLKVVKLSNEAARLNGFQDAGAMWRHKYEIGFLERDVDHLWKEVLPLYEQLHAFVRRKLKSHYGEKNFPLDNTIPAHILGDMWGQNWRNLFNMVIPYPQQPFPDVTQAMRTQGYTPVRIVRAAEDFFKTLGFENLPGSFWRDSIFEKPNNREIVCHASAWDFCNKINYRIKQCTEITMNDLIKAHHEIGHIYYFMSYRDQPLAFRDGANPGFHEAIGDAIALSVSTPQHLQKKGLAPFYEMRFEDDINFLLSMALEKVALLPFGYLVDKWRWRVFSGEITEDNLNTEWWNLRKSYQGVSSPFNVTESDFDAGAKYHVATHTPYIWYFVGLILQFQLHEELCQIAGHRGPIHKCDIYRSATAGARLSEVLRKGRSQPWPQILETLTRGRTNRLDAKPLLRYFSQLQDWLQKQNEREVVGWVQPTASGLTDARMGAFVGIVLAVILAGVAICCICGFCFKRVCSCDETEDKIERDSEG